jgi:hypothetical protein
MKRVITLITATLLIALTLTACVGSSSTPGADNVPASTSTANGADILESVVHTESADSAAPNLYAAFVEDWSNLDLPGTFKCRGDGTSAYTFYDYDHAKLQGGSGFDIYQAEKLFALNVYVWPEELDGYTQRGIGIDTIDVNEVKCFKTVQIYIVMQRNYEQFQNGVKPWEVHLYYNGSKYPLAVTVTESETVDADSDSFSHSMTLSKGYMSNELLSLTCDVLSVLSENEVVGMTVEELVAKMPTPLSVEY